MALARFVSLGRASSLARLIPECGAGDLQHAFRLFQDDVRNSRHSRQQDGIGISSAKDDRISDHALDSGRRFSDLCYLGVENTSWVSIDREPRPLTDLDPPYICLIDFRMNFHMMKVLRDEKERRCLKSGSDCLSDFDVSSYDDAVCWCSDLGPLLFGTSLLEFRSSLPRQPFRKKDIGNCDV